MIDGYDGNDIIDAGGSNDTVIGGLGDDTMNGGAGSDTFVFGPGFGNDVISAFDANPGGGQDFLDISGLGITAANFAASVVITDLGNDTLVNIGGQTITLNGVNGVGANSVSVTDFLLHL